MEKRLNSIKTDGTKNNTYTPTIEMRLFVQTLLSEEVKGNKTEAERRTGVRREVFYYYFKRHPEFRKWFSEQCDAFLGINEAIPSYMLMKKILEGDVQAIRTYYELRSKLKQHLEHSGEIKGGETRLILITPKERKENANRVEALSI